MFDVGFLSCKFLDIVMIIFDIICRKSFGDADVPFCIQSCCKPLNYALAVSEMGSRRVHDFIGQEPSGMSFNELTLDNASKYFQCHNRIFVSHRNTA